VQFFRDRYRVVRYDHRGQGRSAKPKVPSIDIETLYGDAVALIEKLGLAPCHFVGLSMGGFVALRLAARRPDLLRSCILIGTSADPETNAASYRRLNLVARYVGVRPVIDRVMPTMFGRTFMTDPKRAAERAEWRTRLASLDRSIWRAVDGVIEREGVHNELTAIAVPTLVLVGEEDVATTPEMAHRIHLAIPNSRFVQLPEAGHTSTVESPERVNVAMAEFLDGLPGR
jgi:pimeloyl-ACP methyl ester carboxylesterase